MPESDDVTLLADQLKTAVESVAFSSSVDLREYASQISDELTGLEESLIEKYISVGPEVANLHKQITSCDVILERMEGILSNFHKDLGTISSEIQDLQMRSTIMNKRLQNRQSVRGELSQFLSDMVIPEQLIRHIFATPVTEQEFLENLHELDHKIHFSRLQSMSDYRSSEDVHSLLKKLTIKAVTKIREYLLQKIYSFRRPLTNYQIPQNQMLKFRFYNEFLLAHDRESASEIRTEYVNTMSKVYYSYFKAYCSKLNKLHLDTSSEKDILLGKRFDEQSSSVIGAMGFATSAGSATSLGSLSISGTGIRTGMFGLGDRALRVLSRSNLEAAIILPHVATKADAKYPIEVLFRSVHFALLDAACREYFFLSDFFMLSPSNEKSAQLNDHSRVYSGSALAALFELVMGRTLNLIQKQVDTHTIPVASHDALCLLICLQILHAMLRVCAERNVPVMDKFWNTIIEAFWVRVTDRLDAHIASLQNDFDVTAFSNGARSLATGGLSHSSSVTGSSSSSGSNLPARAYSLIRPHPVARRYAELAASLHLIGHEFPGTPLFPDPTDLANKPTVITRRPSTTSISNQLESEFDVISSNEANRRASVPQHSGQTNTAHSKPPQLDPRIISRLAQLQSQFELALLRLADSFPRQRLKCVFLINNYDLVITVLTERGAGDTPEVCRYRENAAKYTTIFIEEALSPYFESLISFVRDVEIRHRTSASGIDEGQSDAVTSVTRNEEARVTRIIKGFNIAWKDSIEKIHEEIMMEFTNFNLGTEIFQALLAQLVQHYHRFQQIMTQVPYANLPVRNQLVNIHHIMNEIKKCKTTF